MRADISFTVSAAERERLQRLASDRNTPAKVVWRARILLGSANVSPGRQLRDTHFSSGESLAR